MSRLAVANMRTGKLGHSLRSSALAPFSARAIFNQTKRRPPVWRPPLFGVSNISTAGDTLYFRSIVGVRGKHERSKYVVLVHIIGRRLVASGIVHGDAWP